MIDPQTFEMLVAEGIDAIPEKFLRRLSNVAVVVEEEPTRTQMQKMRLGRSATLFGLYEGVPQTARGGNYSWVLPDKITIFRKPILAWAGTPDEVRGIVRDTVWHEIAHHFGFSERAVRARERKRADRSSRSEAP